MLQEPRACVRHNAMELKRELLILVQPTRDRHFNVFNFRINFETMNSLGVYPQEIYPTAYCKPLIPK
jgi:hypothetical protein